VKTTEYFRTRVLGDRPEIDPAWRAEIVAAPLRTEVQGDGRIRHWGRVTRSGETRPRVLRVITFADGETFHHAFFDRSYKD